MHFIEGFAFDIAEDVFETLPAVRGGVDAIIGACGGEGVGVVRVRGCGGFSARGKGEEVRFLDDSLHETHGERRVPAVYVCDVSGVSLVDFVDDEAERFADGGVVGSSGGVACTASGAERSLREGGEHVSACAGDKKTHFLEAVEREEVLVAIGVEDERLENFEVFWAETAGDAGFETQQAEYG